MATKQEKQARKLRDVKPSMKMIRTSGIEFTERVCRYIKHLNAHSRGMQRWDVDCSGLQFALLRDQDGMGIRLVFDPTQCNFSRIYLRDTTVDEKQLLGVQKVLGCEDSNQLVIVQFK